MTRLPAGTPLGAGGGAPGKALTAFLATVKKQQWPAIKAALAPSAVAMFDKSYNSPEENASSTADILQAWLPKSGLKIAGGEVRGDTADLDVEGEMFPGTNALYLARLRQVSGTWLFESAGSSGCSGSSRIAGGQSPNARGPSHGHLRRHQPRANRVVEHSAAATRPSPRRSSQASSRLG